MPETRRWIVERLTWRLMRSRYRFARFAGLRLYDRGAVKATPSVRRVWSESRGTSRSEWWDNLPVGAQAWMTKIDQRVARDEAEGKLNA